jgi:hypothetical protein
MFLIWVEKPNLHAVGTPALVVVRASEPSRHLALAKEIEFPAGAKLRQAYPGEPAPVEPIRAWVEAERVVMVGVIRRGGVK